MKKYLQRVSLMIGIGWLSLVSADTMRFRPETDCSLMQQPKALLLVHASWCSHCKRFLPEYTALSKNPAYKNWLFYEMPNDDWRPVCGVDIDAVPVVFVYKMRMLKGANRDHALSDYLDKSAA